MEMEIKIAENRIKEAEERRSYFAKKYEETRQPLYRRMAESETETIAEIRQAIIEACLSK